MYRTGCIAGLAPAASSQHTVAGLTLCAWEPQTKLIVLQVHKSLEFFGAPVEAQATIAPAHTM